MLASVSNSLRVTLQNKPKGFCSGRTLLKFMLVTVVMSHLGVFNVK